MTVGETGKNLPWVEKYRPSKLEDLVSHDDIIKTIGQFMKENQLPHLLFYGPPGTGKTSTILACAKQMYTPQQFNSMVLELNASDDRGIGIVRGQILSFASTRTIFKAGPKLIILDEADAMTNDAQNALRRIKITILGEPFTGKSSLCQRYLSNSPRAPGGTTHGAEVLAGQCLGLRPPVPLQLCDVAGNSLSTGMLRNYLYASDVVLFVYDLSNLQSFDKLNVWIEKVKEIFDQETKKPLMALFGNKSDLEHQRAVRLSCVKQFASKYLLENFKGSARTGEMISEDGIQALLELSGGDMRKVLNTLQSTWLSARDVTEDTVYTCVGHPLRADIDSILTRLMNEDDFGVCFKFIQDLKILKGLALGDILTEIHTKIQRVKFPPDVLISLLIKMADSEARLASGCSERIELAALIAAFHFARQQIDISAITNS
ncbi:Replication factor C subunit 5 [Papilio machaon]|uniref:Replication factor C subunit 5 n=1 Tax=Papilio machaon TaxID=76193 RepID=A0A194QU46_PAPMA|nr:Replication factor C subunit 5 [Papilio machaon]